MTIQDVLKQFNFGFWATGGSTYDKVAEDWSGRGFDAESVRKWLSVGCWSPEKAVYLEGLGYDSSTIERGIVKLACDYGQNIPKAGDPLMVPIVR